MQNNALLVVEFAVMEACAVFAYTQGNRGEQLGAVWFGANAAISATALILDWQSPLAQLIEDGVFAIGLLPLAMIFVSYWIGLVTFIAAALFSLEAIYLLNDMSIDRTYAWINNCLWLSVPLVFLSAGGVNFVQNRREARRTRQAPGAAVLG